jgi:hypothetical protein
MELTEQEKKFLEKIALEKHQKTFGLETIFFIAVPLCIIIPGFLHLIKSNAHAAFSEELGLIIMPIALIFFVIGISVRYHNIKNSLISKLYKHIQELEGKK